MHFPPWHKPGSSWHSLMSADRGWTRLPLWACTCVCVLVACAQADETFQDDSDGVWSEAFSSWTQSLVLSCLREKKQQLITLISNNTAINHKKLFLLLDLKLFFFFFPGLIKPRCIFGEQPVKLRLTGDDCSDADLQTEKKTLLFASQTRAFH